MFYYSKITIMSSRVWASASGLDAEPQREEEGGEGDEEEEEKKYNKVSGGRERNGRKEDRDQASRSGNSAEESMAECLIDAVHGVIIGHCVSLAWDSRKCDR